MEFLRTCAILMTFLLGLKVKCTEGWWFCGTMRPGHEHTIKQGTGDYAITLNAAVTRKGLPLRVKVTLKGGPPFIGFILQARTVQDDRIVEGWWYNRPPGTKALDCSEVRGIWNKPVVSEAFLDESKTFTRVTFLWEATRCNIGPVYFRATVLQDYRAVYENITSRPLDEVCGDPPPYPPRLPAPPPTTTPTPTTTPDKKTTPGWRPIPTASTTLPTPTPNPTPTTTTLLTETSTLPTPAISQDLRATTESEGSGGGDVLSFTELTTSPGFTTFTPDGGSATLQNGRARPELEPDGLGRPRITMHYACAPGYELVGPSKITGYVKHLLVCLALQDRRNVRNRDGTLKHLGLLYPEPCFSQNRASYRTVLDRTVLHTEPCFSQNRASARTVLQPEPCFIQNRASYRTVLHTEPCFSQNRASARTVLHTEPCFIQNRASYRTVLQPEPCFSQNRASARTVLQPEPCFSQNRASARTVLQPEPCFSQNRASARTVLQPEPCFSQNHPQTRFWIVHAYPEPSMKQLPEDLLKRRARYEVGVGRRPVCGRGSAEVWLNGNLSIFHNNAREADGHRGACRSRGVNDSGFSQQNSPVWTGKKRPAVCSKHGSSETGSASTCEPHCTPLPPVPILPQRLPRDLRKRSVAGPMFEDVTSLTLDPADGSNPSQRYYGMTVTDVNRDGKMEIFVVSYGGPNLVLKWNPETRRYENIAVDNPESPYYFLRDPEGNGISVTACDIDGDGWEEIYIVNTQSNSVEDSDLAQADRLYHFHQGRYRDVLREEYNLGLGQTLSGKALFWILLDYPEPCLSMVLDKTRFWIQHCGFGHLSPAAKGCNLGVTIYGSGVSSGCHPALTQVTLTRQQLPPDLESTIKL
ncbi:hypothetical protein Bbelb_300810 [Branchiostoma belcheri]|nr:hypothetical protein Bbelb_300810 [Branchiostoma belcheri]